MTTFELNLFLSKDTRSTEVETRFPSTMEPNLRISAVGTTPYSTVPWNAPELRQREPPRPMSYVMSFPSVVQDLAVDPNAIEPGRDPANFFKQQDESSEAATFVAPSELACQPDHRQGRKQRGGLAQLRPAPPEPSTLPRDTIHPLISQLQAEENAKAAYFHPEVGYLSNARGDDRPCKAHTYVKGGASRGQNVVAELNRSMDGSDDEGTAHADTTLRNARRFNKRGDLSTAVGRRFFTDGCLHESDHYASNVAEVANTQPTRMLDVVAKALANAIHNPSNEARRVKHQNNTTPAFRNLSAGLQEILKQRNRDGRFEVAQYLEQTNSLALPPPLKPDRGVDVDAVEIRHNPFVARKIYAPNDGPDPIDQVDVGAKNVGGACGLDSTLNVWNTVIRLVGEGPADAAEAALEVPTVGESDTSSSAPQTPFLKNPRVLTHHAVSLFGSVSAFPELDALVGKGIRQGVSLRQPTAPSKSSFADHGVIPTTQFSDLDSMPPNSVGFDSERLGIVLSRYGDQLREVMLDGATWFSRSSLAEIGTFCPLLQVLNLSSCPQVDDACIAAITVGCPSLSLVNLSCCKGVTSSSLESILSNTSNLVALSVSGLEQLGEESSVAWSLLHRHGTLRFLDVSFCIRLPDAALVHASLFCPDLEMLDISGCSLLTDNALLSIGGSCRKLSVLRLRLCAMFTPSAVEAFASASTQLAHVDFTGCLQITTQTIEGFLARCPHISSLNLSSCNHVDDDTMIVLQHRAQQLESLNLSGCSSVTSDSLMRLIHTIKSLKSIDLSGTRTSKTELFLLASVRESCRITKAAAEVKAKRRLHAFLSVEPKKPAPKAAAKGKR